jgi:hypothetical protein
MADKTDKDATGSLRPGRRTRRVILDSDDEDAADSPNITSSVYNECNRGSADSTNVTAELESHGLIQTQLQNDSSEVISTKTNQNKPKNKQVASSTLTMQGMDNNRAMTSFLRVPLLNRSTIPEVLV